MRSIEAPSRIRHRRPAALALLVLVAALAAPLAALGANVTATATISGGALALSSSATPSISLTLDGLDKTPTYTVPIAVTDPRGTGGGWHVTLTSPTVTTASPSRSPG